MFAIRQLFMMQICMQPANQGLSVFWPSGLDLWDVALRLEPGDQTGEKKRRIQRSLPAPWKYLGALNTGSQAPGKGSKKWNPLNNPWFPQYSNGFILGEGVHFLTPLRGLVQI